MRIEGSTVLVTGADGGLGENLAAELVARGARRVYAAVRAGDSSVDDLVALAPDRILPLILDVTDDAQARTASRAATDVTLLISNAGVMASGHDGGRVQRDLAINFLGIIRVSRAFAPVLEANGGTLVNVLTMIGFGPAAGMSARRTCGAAAQSVTHALRNLLIPRGVGVVGVYPGAMSTTTPAGAGIPAADPAGVTRRALDGVEAGSPEITPGDFSARCYASWRENPAELARQCAGWPHAGPMPPAPLPAPVRGAGRLPGTAVRPGRPHRASSCPGTVR